MKKYLIRLDDASEQMNVDNWLQIEKLLVKYSIKPLVGIIPNNESPEFSHYMKNPKFWTQIVPRWLSLDWDFALHGYNHVYSTKLGGINPIHQRSEFAGHSYNIQREKIKAGFDVLKKHGITPAYFFAPSHTFDLLTLKAISDVTNIKVISDTFANDVYYKNEFFFIPQQFGAVRNSPFKLTTFCYHPNTMEDKDFERLEIFLKKNRFKFLSFKLVDLKKRKLSLLDKFYNRLYFIYLSLRKVYSK